MKLKICETASGQFQNKFFLPANQVWFWWGFLPIFKRKLEKNKMKLKIWETATGQLKIVVVFIPSNQVWFWWFCKCFNYKYQEIVVFHIYCCKCNISAATILCQIAAGHETNRLEELPNIGRSSNLAIMRFP